MPTDFLRQGGVGFQKKLKIICGEFEVLYPVFAKLDAAEADNLFYRIEVGRFCYNDERYFGVAAFAMCAGGSDVVVNFFQIVG